MKIRTHLYTATALITAIAGCTQTEAPPARPAAAGPAAELAQNFDPADTGTVQGRILWEGPMPIISTFEIHPELDSHPNLPHRGTRSNPNAPRVNSQNHGVAQAVVFLRRVDLRRSRPWDHAAVLVENVDWQIKICQGSEVSSTGFVRRGTAFEIVSRQKVLHILRGHGAAFFSLPLPDPDVVSTRILEKTGHVSLSSGADCFWMRGHLFVDDHPYFVRSDSDGKFVLPSVPAGTYQVVCWLPNWNIGRRERNAEVGLLARIRYCPAMEKEATVTIDARGTSSVDFTVSEKDFPVCVPPPNPIVARRSAS